MELPRQTNRAFGFTLAALLLFISAVAFVGFGSVLETLIAAAGVVALVALVRPGWLLLFHLIWRALLGRIARVNTFLILSLLFYVVITPVALWMKLVRRDPMNRRFEPGRQSSYWTPVGRQLNAETFNDQF